VQASRNPSDRIMTYYGLLGPGGATEATTMTTGSDRIRLVMRKLVRRKR